MLELVKQIKEYTEAGIILNHMHLFDRLEDYFTPVEPSNFNESEQMAFERMLKMVIDKESCNNCIYWMEDLELCSNSVVTHIYSDVEVKDDWCELWRSEDEVVSEKDYK